MRRQQNGRGIFLDQMSLLGENPAGQDPWSFIASHTNERIYELYVVAHPKMFSALRKLERGEKTHTRQSSMLGHQAFPSAYESA